MFNSSIVNQIRDQYIETYLECAKKLHYTDLNHLCGMQTVLFDDLHNLEINGYPTASDMIDKNGNVYSMTEFESLPLDKKLQCRLRFSYLPYYHELYVGTTGSGKTTGCVEPQIRAITTQKNKPNLFITDPKGELFERNAEHLKNMGYRLFLLNFKNPTRSDRWNPFLVFYQKAIRLKEIGSKARMRPIPIDPTLEQVASPDDYRSSYIEYEGKAFPDGDMFDRYIRQKKDELRSELESLVNSWVCTMIPVQSKHEPSWEYGAQDLLRGLFLAMIEDAMNPESGLTEDMLNFKTLYRYYLAIRTPILSSLASKNNLRLRQHPLLKNKDPMTIAAMSSALDNAPVTMKSYCGVFEGAINKWKQGHIFALTSGNTIDLNDTNDQPFAFFLITRDHDKSDNLIAGLAVDWVYRQVLENVEAGKTTRPTHFLLDEFANIPQIVDFENKISTSRSRNIWFHLFVQSYQQLNNVYGDTVSQIIQDNCNAQIFLGSQSILSKQIFAKECGNHYIPTLESRLNPADNSITMAPVLPISALDLIKPGEMYIKRLYMPLFTSQYIRSYTCVNYGFFSKCKNGFDSCAPRSFASHSDEKFNYKILDKFIGTA